MRVGPVGCICVGYLSVVKIVQKGVERSRKKGRIVQERNVLQGVKSEWTKFGTLDI